MPLRIIILNMPKRIAAALSLLSLLIPAFGGAQLTLSPYSHYGLGDIYSAAGTRNFSMGGLGIPIYDPASINPSNPASYADLKLTTLHLGGQANYSFQQSRFNTYDRLEAGFYNASVAFANGKNFGFTAGLSPYSNTGYTVQVRDSLMQDTLLQRYTTTYSADGGLNQFYLGVGFKFFKRLSVGMNLTYAFGVQNYNWRNNFDDGSLQDATIEKRVQLSGVVPQLGLMYGDTLKFSRQVNQSILMAKEEKDLDRAMRDLEGERRSLEKDRRKRDAKDAQVKQEIESLKAQRKSLLDKAESIDAGGGDRKEVTKLQEKAYRLDKKRKKLEQKNRSEEQALLRTERRLEGRVNKIKDRRAAIQRKRELIAKGEADSLGTRTSSALFRIGLTAEPGSRLGGERLVQYDNEVTVDSVGTLTEGNVRLPARVGFGVSFAKPHKWMLGADITLQDWSNLQYFDEVTGLNREWRASIGGEYIPDFVSGKYFRRAAYRMGAFYRSTLLNVDATPVSEYGVTFGVGLPLGYINPFTLTYSRLSLGVQLSRRGSLTGDLLRETTVLFRLGVSLNDIWFIKRRVD